MPSEVRTIEVENWTDLSKIVERELQPESEHSKFVFRGQADARWTLKTSLHRVIENAGSKNALVADQIEKHSIREFKSQAHLHVPASALPIGDDDTDWRVLMQHHGAPTRLLDWSRSFWVALYFAAVEHPELDGAVWVVDRTKLKPLWTDTERPGPCLNVFTTSRFATQRFVAQQTMFSISPSSDVRVVDQLDLLTAHQDACDVRAVRKFTFPKYRKITFIRRLRAMNISANSLFPGINGLGRHVREMMETGDQGDWLN